MTFQKQSREKIILWMYNLKHLQKLKRYGYIIYVSNKMKYAVLYVNSENLSDTLKKLHKLHFVRNVESVNISDKLTDFQQNFKKYREKIANRKDIEVK